MHRFHPIWRTWGPWLLLALLAASLIPILLLGRYDWPSADDYSYALRTHEAIVQGQCPLTASLKHIAEYYKGWQGTFSAILLMTFTPLTVSPFLYWLTPVVMLASLCLGTFKLSDTLARRALGGTWRQTVFLAVPILLLSIQFVASPKDTFYWWNGAVYYTFTYGISLLLMERMVALKLAATRRQVLWAVVPGTLAALMVGGSNYVSALLSTLLCGLFLLWFLWKDRTKVLPALLPTAVLCAGFLISVVAPGNGVRQASVAPPISPVDAVMESILKAWEDCLDWMNWPILLVFLLMIPLLWSLTERISFRFPLPLAFLAFSFLLFAAQNAPHFYALGGQRSRAAALHRVLLLFLAGGRQSVVLAGLGETGGAAQAGGGGGPGGPALAGGACGAGPAGGHDGEISLLGRKHQRADRRRSGRRLGGVLLAAAGGPADGAPGPIRLRRAAGASGCATSAETAALQRRRQP